QFSVPLSLQVCNLHSVTSLKHKFLFKDCKEFVDYCVNRGVDRNQLCMGDSVSAEEISKVAFERCLQILTAPNHIESLTTRYNTLVDLIDFTNRVAAFLASALFYFGFAPERLTPMVRPLVECMQNEQNSTVSAEIFRGAVTLMIAYSWPRTPRPYVKVLGRAMDMFSSCSSRIPKPQEWSSKEVQHVILSIQRPDSEKASPSPQSTNAELMFLVCTTFSVDQLPEFYDQFALDSCETQEELLSRLALHDCMWSRVGSSLSDVSTPRIIELLKSSNPAFRFAGAKAVETFARSRLGDTISRLLAPLSGMLNNVSVESERRGAIEALLRLSLMHTALTGVVSLLAPLAFVRMTDKLEEDVSAAVPDLSEELSAKRAESADFVNVLSAPGRLALVETKTIRGLCKTIQLRHYQAQQLNTAPMRFCSSQIYYSRKESHGYGFCESLDYMAFWQRIWVWRRKLLQTDYGALGFLTDEWGGMPILISRCSLIICPRTLVDHWCNEWRRFFPGRTPARHVEGAPAKWKAAEIVVAAYEDLKGNSSLGYLFQYFPENYPADLWALFTWLMPGYLGDERHFRARFLRKILKCRSHKANEKDIQVLRELPDKNVQDYECQLSEEQRTIYKFIVDRCTANRAQLAARRGISPLHALMALRQLVDHPLLIQDVLTKLGAPEEIMKLVPTASSGKIAALGQLLSECGIGVSFEEEDPEDENPLSSIPVELPHRALIFCQWKSSVQLVSNALSRQRRLWRSYITSCSRWIGSLHQIANQLSIDSTRITSLTSLFDYSFKWYAIAYFRRTCWQIIPLLLRGPKSNIGGVGLNLTGADVALIGADNRSLQTMATDELMNMFVLDGDQPSKENGGPEAKRRRKTAAASDTSSVNGEERWNLAELWDESQYEQQFDVSQFIKEAV
ncbi:SNF2 family protein, partial [Ostertagia ostertagi]